jgi:DNA-binding beta-propeller fold protein YncE
MVSSILRRNSSAIWASVLLTIALSVWTPARAAKIKVDKNAPPPPPDLLLPEGRKLVFARMFETDRDVEPKHGFWTKVFDTVVGAPDRHRALRPYSIAVDSRGRVIVTDPGAMGVHIFNFPEHKYKFISRHDKDENSLISPQCVAVDAEDNFYVTDSQTGRVFVYEAGGKFKRYIGALKGGEGFFKRPTGIAVDSAVQRIYVTDTLRNKVFVLDMNGNVLKTIGKPGTQPGEFNYPTEVVLHGPDMAVVDAMNFRVQVFDREGAFKYAVGSLGDGVGTFFRPKGIGFDSEDHLYVVDAAWDRVQVFDEQGDLLYYFGTRGVIAGTFNLPAGLFIDHSDMVYVVDSYNSRVQVFHYFAKHVGSGGQ